MQADNFFCLRWNDFEENARSVFEDLRKTEDNVFCDVSLCCDGFGEPDAPERLLKAHKVVLSACSPFFRDVLTRLQHNSSNLHPVVFLRGVKRSDLKLLLDFMYFGEVNVTQEDLTSFLAVAEDLKIKGLTNSDQSKKYKSQASTPSIAKSSKHKLDSDVRRIPGSDNTAKRQRTATQSRLESASEVMVEDSEEIRIDGMSRVKKELSHEAEAKLFSGGGDQSYEAEADDYEAYEQYEEEEGEEFTAEAGQSLGEDAGEGTSDGAKDYGSEQHAMEFSLSTSEKGNVVLCLSGYEYLRRNDRVSASGSVTWRCRKFSQLRCTANVTTNGNLIVRAPGVHCHPPGCGHRKRALPADVAMPF